MEKYLKDRSKFMFKFLKKQRKINYSKLLAENDISRKVNELVKSELFLHPDGWIKDYGLKKVEFDNINGTIKIHLQKWSM